MKWKYKLGIRAKSVVSGFKGTIGARAKCLANTDRYWIQPVVGSDGKQPEGCWFDDNEVAKIAGASTKAKVIIKKFEYDLGDEIVCKITGFRGTIIETSQHMNGCNLCWVQPKVNTKKEYVEGRWVSEKNIKVAKPATKQKPIKTGGFPSATR